MGTWEGAPKSTGLSTNRVHEARRVLSGLPWEREMEDRNSALLTYDTAIPLP